MMSSYEYFKDLCGVGTPRPNFQRLIHYAEPNEDDHKGNREVLGWYKRKHSIRTEDPFTRTQKTALDVELMRIQKKYAVSASQLIKILQRLDQAAEPSECDGDSCATYIVKVFEPQVMGSVDVKDDQVTLEMGKVKKVRFNMLSTHNYESDGDSTATFTWSTVMEPQAMGEDREVTPQMTKGKLCSESDGDSGVTFIWSKIMLSKVVRAGDENEVVFSPSQRSIIDTDSKRTNEVSTKAGLMAAFNRRHRFFQILARQSRSPPSVVA